MVDDGSFWIERRNRRNRASWRTIPDIDVDLKQVWSHIWINIEAVKWESILSGCRNAQRSQVLGKSTWRNRTEKRGNQEWMI